MNLIHIGSGISSRIATVTAVLVLSFVMLGPGVSAYAGGGTPTPSPTSAGSYGGRAWALGIQLPLGGGGTYADTGDLPSSGGALFTDYGTISTGVGDVSSWLTYTRGFSDTARSEAATSDLTLFPGSLFDVGASFVYAGSGAGCDGVSGASEIFDLTIGGVTFGVSGAPNEVIYEVPGVFSLIANEQTDSSSGSVHAITVNALHAWLQGTDVTVSHAASSVDCGGIGGGLPFGSSGGMFTRSSGGGIQPTHAPPADFMTGGGFFFANPALSTCPNAHVNFGFNAGPRPGNPTDVKGHLNVIDHDCNHHLDGTDVTDYFRFSAVGNDPQDVCRIWAGPAKWDGVTGYHYDAVTCDYGEPGRYDRFHVEVRFGNPPNYQNPAVYVADNARGTCPSNMPNCGDLTGGNIQLHRF